MFLLIALAFILPVFEVDTARLSELASNHAQQSTYWENQLKLATVSGTQTKGDPKTDTRFTYSIDGERSCIHFKNESPQDDEAFETVSVYTPKHFFHLIKEDKDSEYYIDSITLRDENETEKDVLRINFYKILKMEAYSHGATRAFDLSVADILNQNGWEIEEVQDATDENNEGVSPANVSVTAKSTVEDNYDKVNVVLAPKNRYAVVSYKIHLTAEENYESVRSGTVAYTNHNSDVQLAQVSVKDLTEGNGESFDNHRQATFESFSNNCDEAVFTLSHYGLSDSLLEKPTDNRTWYLIAAALSGAVCVFILLQKTRSRS